MDHHSATVWVEVSAPCTVEVAGGSAATFAVAGHHYALVLVTGLAPGTSTPYEVRLDGQPVWPEPASQLPPSRIRTPPVAGDRRQRLVFGSCRKPPTRDAKRSSAHGTDALAAYALRMARLPEDQWPEALLLLGDQVYADETTPETREWLRTRRNTGEPPGVEVANFEEYVRLYHESWRDPPVRWLLSTVPSSMIFDDHDVRDDWNTSRAWREWMQAQPWWRERIRGALMSYWIYQHIGNLGPEELATDEMFQAVTTAPRGTDTADTLAAFADRADGESRGTKGARWSFRRDFGRVRLLVVDTRSGRILHGTERSMISESEFAWVERNADGEMDHLLIGSSLPWLLPPLMHQLESLNEQGAAAGGRWGRWCEKVRQAVDMEHWSAFAESSVRLARLIEHVARRRPAEGPPATVCVLSGDVHHGYTARARFGQPLSSAVYQLTCSPIHNLMPPKLRAVFRLAWWRPVVAPLRWLARLRRVTSLPVTWRKVAGPYFGNAVATLDLDGRHATVTVEHASTGADGPRLRAVPPTPLA